MNEFFSVVFSEPMPSLVALFRWFEHEILEIVAVIRYVVDLFLMVGPKHRLYSFEIVLICEDTVATAPVPHHAEPGDVCDFLFAEDVSGFVFNGRSEAVHATLLIHDVNSSTRGNILPIPEHFLWYGEIKEFYLVRSMPVLFRCVFFQVRCGDLDFDFCGPSRTADAEDIAFVYTRAPTDVWYDDVSAPVQI